MSEGSIKDLDALVQLIDYAARLSGDCSHCFVDDLGSVLTGISNGNSAVSEWEHRQGKFEYDTYYVHAEKFGQSGYATAFQDPDPELTGGNQAHHFWFYVQVGFESGELIAGAVNAVHETFIPLRPAGKSYQDLTLGYEGASLGSKLKAGSIDLASVATYTNSVLSPGSSQASYWTYMHTAAWNAINQFPANPH